MGLLTIIRKIKRKEKEMRILMVGLDNSGKTTIVLKINGEDTSIISPTLGFNIKTIKYQKYSLNIWDVGGQKTIRSYWRNYFEQTDGLVWVVDSSDLRRMNDCRMELGNLLKEEAEAVQVRSCLREPGYKCEGGCQVERRQRQNSRSNKWLCSIAASGIDNRAEALRIAVAHCSERLSGASLLILANKQDIQGALKPAEIAKVLNLDALDKTRHWNIVGCSAYSGDGLFEGFDWLVQDIASRIYVID